MGKADLFLLGISMILSIFTGIIDFYMASSRLLVSIARALPQWCRKVDNSEKVPKNVVCFTMFVSLIAPWFGRQVLSWVVDMASAGAAIGYLYTTASAYKFIRAEKNNSIKKTMSLIGIGGVQFYLFYY